jgi:hypothetical protein
LDLIILSRRVKLIFFCYLRIKIEAVDTPNSEIPPPSDYHFIPGNHLTPNFESLVAQMEAAILRGQARNAALARHVQENYAWEKIAKQLGGVFCS